MSLTPLSTLVNLRKSSRGGSVSAPSGHRRSSNSATWDTSLPEKPVGEGESDLSSVLYTWKGRGRNLPARVLGGPRAGDLGWYPVVRATLSV